MKEINNSEDSKCSDDNNQSYGSDMSPESISRPISSKNEEDDCSETESDILPGTCTQEQIPHTC